MPNLRRLAPLALALLGACGPANYAYRFDITDPGARNITRPGERATIEDADIRAEILVDPTSFQAILLDLTNLTNQPVVVNWLGISVVGPDGNQLQVRPDAPPAPGIEPTARAVTRLIPFSLPSRGALAEAYGNQSFVLNVPMIVRGAQREYHWHLRANLLRL